MNIIRKPAWLKQDMYVTKALGNVRRILKNYSLHTVCEEAHCPNRNRCYASGQATFLIMGDVCTRNCRFCAISTGKPLPLDPDEPERLSDAARKLNLRYVVITSVTRDDISDGGASHFAKTIRQIRKKLPDAGIEVLTPDFLGDKDALDIVLFEKPDVFNHNVETVLRLYPSVRPQANYQRSLMVLRYAKDNSSSIIKSGFMLGLGETEDEVFSLLRDLKSAGVDVVTIGQYLQPSERHFPLKSYVSPKKFEQYSKYGEEELGFKRVFAGPMVRSSFIAEDIWKQINA
ncbi:lipoyl synthase [bacterium]|nr:lipoyl synthase [bacterium]